MALPDLPMLGHFAWMPLPSVDEVDIIDRFNGVPTIGVFKAPRVPDHLFWRAVGYVSEFSFWLYVPLDAREVHQITSAEDNVLNGIVHDLRQGHSATVAVALDNRLVFEREWTIPARLRGDGLTTALLDFLSEALSVALDHDLPPSRREIYQRAKNAAHRLAA